jgi:hypothetical protein
VTPATSGAASCPLSWPAENVHAGTSRATLAALIWSGGLNRVLALIASVA